MRKTKTITLIEDGQELKFLIKQMSAMGLTRWCAHLAFVLGKTDFELPGGADPADMANTLKERGLGRLLRGLSGLDVNDVQPLMDELLACCYHVSGPNSMTQLTPDIVDGIVGEMLTLLRLQGEALELNLGFMLPEGTVADLFASLSGSQTVQPTASSAR